MTYGVCEHMWFQISLDELGICDDAPIRLYCDNKAVINIAHNPMQHYRTKHVEIDRHFIKEKLDKGLICMPFLKSKNQLANVFTKELNGKFFNPIYLQIEHERYLCTNLRRSVTLHYVKMYFQLKANFGILWIYLNWNVAM